MADLAVVNASPLIFLGAANRLELLRSVAPRVCVPEPVLREVMAHGAADPAAVAVGAAAWLEKGVPAAPSPPVLAWDLGPGETSVISLAMQVPRSVAVLDDLQGRRCAESLGLPVSGTLGIVLLAKSRGQIPLARPLLEELRDRGMWLSDRVLAQALRLAGE